jgi:hypothetical protein
MEEDSVEEPREIHPPGNTPVERMRRARCESMCQDDICNFCTGQLDTTEEGGVGRDVQASEGETIIGMRPIVFYSKSHTFSELIIANRPWGCVEDL